MNHKRGTSNARSVTHLLRFIKKNSINGSDNYFLKNTVHHRKKYVFTYSYFKQYSKIFSEFF